MAHHQFWQSFVNCIFPIFFNNNYRRKYWNCFDQICFWYFLLYKSIRFLYFLEEIPERRLFTLQYYIILQLHSQSLLFTIRLFLGLSSLNVKVKFTHKLAWTSLDFFLLKFIKPKRNSSFVKLALSKICNCNAVVFFNSPWFW